jgi:hypothetical protein
MDLRTVKFIFSHFSSCYTRAYTRSITALSGVLLEKVTDKMEVLPNSLFHLFRLYHARNTRQTTGLEPPFLNAVFTARFYYHL